MGSQHSSLASSIDEIRQGIADGSAAALWHKNNNKSKKYVELTVGGRKWHVNELLLSLKFSERLVGSTLVDLEASQTPQHEQQKEAVCKLAVALLSWHNSGAWGAGIAFNRWSAGCKHVQSIVAGKTVVTRDETSRAAKVANQQQAVRMAFPQPGEDEEVMEQLMMTVVSQLQLMIKQSPCLLHTPGLCNGACSSAAANGAAAKDWVLSTLDLPAPSVPPVLQPAGGDAAGTSAAAAAGAGASRAASNDAGRVQEEQTGVGVPRSAAASDPDSVDAAGAESKAIQPGNSSSDELVQPQQQKGQQQQPPATSTQSAADALSEGKQQLSEEQAAAAADADAYAAEASSDLMAQELLLEACDQCENIIMRTIVQVLDRTKPARVKAEEQCRQHIVEIFRSLPCSSSSSSNWQQDMQSFLTRMSQAAEDLIFITQPSVLRSHDAYQEFIRCLRNMTNGPFTARQSMYGDVTEELGKGACGRVVRCLNLRTQKEEAIKQVVINTFTPDYGKNKKLPRSMQLTGDLADLMMMNPGLAAKEYILAQYVGAAAEAFVGKPHGCWIEEVAVGRVTAVVLHLPMAEGLDLDRLKLAYVGSKIPGNEFLALDRPTQELMMEAFALTMGRGLALSLHHAHSKHIYHSDVKMTNAMVMQEGVLQLESLPLKRRLQFLADPPVDVVLIDWGLARAARPVGAGEKFTVVKHDHGTRYVRPIELAGTKDLKHVAPELVGKLDVWCAGFLMAEAIHFDYTSAATSVTSSKDTNKKTEDTMSRCCTLDFTNMTGTSEKNILGRVEELKSRLKQCGASRAFQNLVGGCLDKTPHKRLTAQELYNKCEASLTDIMTRLRGAKMLPALALLPESP